MYSCDACVILAGECPATGDHSYFADVQVAPIDPFHAEVTERGAALTKSLHGEPWGMREFGIRTVDGHRMVFGAPAPA